MDVHTKAAVTRVEKMEQGGWLCYYKEGSDPEKTEQESWISADGLLVAVGEKSLWGRRVFAGNGNQGRCGKRKNPADEKLSDTDSRNLCGRRCDRRYTARPCGYSAGLLALDHMEGRCPSRNLQIIPSCVYTDPEIACAGITADEAKAAGIPVKTGKYIMSLNGKSLLSGQERGFIKLVAEEGTGRLLGAQLMCARATDMIGAPALAIATHRTCRSWRRQSCLTPPLGKE